MGVQCFSDVPIGASISEKGRTWTVRNVKYNNYWDSIFIFRGSTGIAFIVDALFVNISILEGIIDYVMLVIIHIDDFIIAHLTIFLFKHVFLYQCKKYQMGNQSIFDAPC